jgi:hypothetical protein
VELGQLAVVALAATGYLGVRKYPAARKRLEWGAVAALGACSGFWLLQRVAGWLGELRTVFPA